MTEALIHDLLRTSARRSGVFTLDAMGRLKTANPRKLLGYLLEHRLVALADHYLTIEDERLSRVITYMARRIDLERSFIDWQARSVVGILQEQGVSCVIVKGPVAARRYPLRKLRPYTDLDLFVDRSQVHAARATLAGAGFVLLAPAWSPEILRRHAELQMKLNMPGVKVIVDIHWDLVSSPSLRRGRRFDLREIPGHLAAFRLDGVGALTFSPEMNLLFLIAHHILHHQVRGVIWLLDILLVLHQEPALDWDEVRRLALRFGLESALHYYGRMLRRIGFPLIPERVLRSVEPRSVRYALASWTLAPDSVFCADTVLLRYRRRLLREAFKLPECSS